MLEIELNPHGKPSTDWSIKLDKARKMANNVGNTLDEHQTSARVAAIGAGAVAVYFLPLYAPIIALLAMLWAMVSVCKKR